jgi:hypothetical protein
VKRTKRKKRARRDDAVNTEQRELLRRERVRGAVAAKQLSYKHKLGPTLDCR